MSAFLSMSSAVVTPARVTRSMAAWSTPSEGLCAAATISSRPAILSRHCLQRQTKSELRLLGR